MNKVIPIGEHLYVVDEGEIQEGDWVIMNDEHPQGRLRKIYYFYEDQLMLDSKDDPNRGYGFLYRNECKRIITSTNPDLGLPLLPLPDEQKSLHQLTKEYCEANKVDRGGSYNYALQDIHKAFQMGYTAAKGKGRYSEEDMRKAYYRMETRYKGEPFEVFIKSLKPVPIGVELEWEPQFRFKIDGKWTEPCDFDSFLGPHIEEVKEDGKVLKTEWKDKKRFVIVKCWIYE